MLFRVEFHEPQDIPIQDRLYMDTIDRLTDSERAYMENKTGKIISSLPEIDRKLDEASEGWTLARMGKVELTILRLAVYEMLYDDDIPVNVAVDEAVELAKTYGSDASPSFINGVLAKLM